MGQPRKIRDPVHDFVSLSAKEADVVGTAVVQRLRGIRQLALASLVYPGAVHTRFDHSLGVCHVSGLLAESLGMDEEDRSLVRLAALLHDAGHGPFSHVSEYALELYGDRSQLTDGARSREKIHELLTQEIIRTDPDLRQIIGQQDCDRIAQLIATGYGSPILREIVSGPLDADKQDYLLRDSYFCGVQYGVFDLNQLHRVLRSVEDPADHSKQLMVSPDGVHALEQFVLAKYYLTTQVYRHKVRLITDQMLLRSVVLGVEVDEIEELRGLYAYDGTEGFVANYREWDDARFLVVFRERRYEGAHCGRLVRRLCARSLLKRVYEAPVRQLPEESRDFLSRISEPSSKDKRRQLECKIAPLIAQHAEQDIEPAFVIAHAYTIKSVREESRNDEGPILIDRHPTPLPFEEESTLFRSIDRRSSDAFIEVYAPVDYDRPEDRQKLRNSLREPITELMATFATSEGESDADA